MVPHRLAVGLDEVGVAAGGGVHRGQAVVGELRVLLGGRRAQRPVGGVAGEPVDALVAEEPLGVGLAGAEHRGQVRQARTDDDHRQPRLADLVAGRAERRDVVGPEVLHLVDEDAHALADVGGQPAHVGEQLDEVDLDVAGVGASAGGGHVDAGAPPVPELGVGARLALGEGPQHPEHLVDLVLLGVAQLADRLVQRAGQRAPQPLVGARLELAGAPAAAYGRRAQRVEQHRLADPAQPGQHQRALGAPARDPLEHDVEGAQLLVAPGQLGRALAGAGGVGVAHGVHDRTVSASLAESDNRLASRIVARLSRRAPPGHGRPRTPHRGPRAAARSARGPRRRAGGRSRCTALSRHSDSTTSPSSWCQETRSARASPRRSRKIDPVPENVRGFAIDP